MNVLMARTNARKTLAQLGVSPTTAAKLEDGGGGNLGTVEKMAKALGLATPTDLLTYPVRSGGEHASFLTEVARMFNDPARRRLMHLIGTVRDEHLDAFEEHCKSFKAQSAKPRDRLHPSRR